MNPRRALLPPAGYQRLGNKIVPIDHARIAREKMQAAAGQAAHAARSAVEALAAADAARDLAQAAVREAQSILIAAGASGESRLIELDSKAAQVLRDADGFVQAALRASRQTVEIHGQAVQERQRIADTTALAVETIERIAASLVGIAHISMKRQDDDVFLIIVLTDGKVLRHNVRGMRGLGSSGPPGADGRDGVDGITEAQVLALIEAAMASPDIGVWDYKAGVSGSVTLTGNKRVTRITAIALGAGGTVQINSGDVMQVPYDATDSTSSDLTIEPKGNLVDPTIVFTGTDGYVIEWVTG